MKVEALVKGKDTPSGFQAGDIITIQPAAPNGCRAISIVNNGGTVNIQ